MLSLGLWLGAHETLLCQGTSFEMRNGACSGEWSPRGRAGTPRQSSQLALTQAPLPAVVSWLHMEEELGFRGRELNTSVV